MKYGNARVAEIRDCVFDTIEAMDAKKGRPITHEEIRDNCAVIYRKLRDRDLIPEEYPFNQFRRVVETEYIFAKANAGAETKGKCFACGLFGKRNCPEHHGG